MNAKDLLPNNITHTHARARTYTHARTHKHTRARVCTHIRTRTHARAHTHALASTHSQARTRKHAFARTHTRAYVRACAHRHTYTTINVVLPHGATQINTGLGTYMHNCYCNCDTFRRGVERQTI